jgi:hypothetical protein
MQTLTEDNTMEKITRENWLNEAIHLINADIFLHHGKGIADNVRVSCGFPGGGSARTRIGECWNPDSSEDNVTEMFISPLLAAAVGNASEAGVLDTLVHEMVHAIVGTECGHKGAFKHLARAVGLEGKLTATHAGDELSATLDAINSTLIERWGAYPHAPLKVNKRKKGSRLIKVTCDGCDNIARQSRTAYETFGLRCDYCNVRMNAAE